MSPSKMLMYEPEVGMWVVEARFGAGHYRIAGVATTFEAVKAFVKKDQEDLNRPHPRYLYAESKWSKHEVCDGTKETWFYDAPGGLSPTFIAKRVAVLR